MKNVTPTCIRIIFFLLRHLTSTFDMKKKVHFEFRGHNDDSDVRVRAECDFSSEYFA